MSAKRTLKGRKAETKKPPALDPVNEASDESFPASDAPSWMGNEPTDAEVGKKKKTL